MNAEGENPASRSVPWMWAALERRLSAEALGSLRTACDEVRGGTSGTRTCALLAQVSRTVKRRPLAPSEDERRDAAARLEGWNPERWTLLETARAALILSQRDLAGEAALAATEEAFLYADEGELCALYRTLAHWPAGERFAARAGEGARSNMRSVFEAACCDTPFPVRVFDDLAWRQAVIKCIFVEAPLWRFFGLDGRLSAELARMALDLADERRSAGRTVRPELWLCLGDVAGQRGLESLERELASDHVPGRRAAALALARAGEADRLRSLVTLEANATVRDTMDQALDGRFDQEAFRELDSSARASSS